MPFAFVPAQERDARTIAQLRARIWATTYRGIYPDELIDRFDYPCHESRDRRQILDGTCHVYLILDGSEPVGYFSFQDAGRVHIRSLYVLQDRQGRGAGKAAFGIVREYCKSRALPGFSCNCNQHNLRAQGFYEHMGGRVVRVDGGHANRQEDQLTLWFDL